MLSILFISFNHYHGSKTLGFIYFVSLKIHRKPLVYAAQCRVSSWPLQNKSEPSKVTPPKVHGYTQKTSPQHCANIHLCHEAIFALASTMKSHHHLHWSHANIHLYHEPWQHYTLALALALKLHQYLYWSRDNIHLCHEATSILHLRRSRANVHLCHEAMTTLHISINFQRQHSSDIEGA